MTIFRGSDAFSLHDTHGLPISLVMEQCEKHDMMIDWIGYIRTARRHHWWDFRIYSFLLEGFADSRAWHDKQSHILATIRSFMLFEPSLSYEKTPS